MSDAAAPTRTEEPDPDASPFAIQAIEGIPYKKGSEEDLAIKQIIREADQAREAQRRAAEEAAR